jgi:hypothetical protein
MDSELHTQSETIQIKTQILHIKTQLTAEQNTITEAKNRCNILETRLQELQKKLLDVEFSTKFKELILIDLSNEFNEWWQLWLRLYDQIYKDNKTNKYYYINDGCIKEISIINNFPSNKALNINNIYYHKIITYGYQKCYLYKYVETDKPDIYYIYQNNKWSLYELLETLNSTNVLDV